MKASGIYRIVHIESGREYIGQAADIRARWNGHRCALNGGRHHSKPLLAAWNKYGAGAFSFEVLLQCPVEELTAAEQREIDERKPYYNTAPVAGSTRGLKQSAAATAKKIGRKASPETRAKMSAARKGGTISPEQRDKISRTLTGRKRTPEVVAKMRASLIGRVIPEDVRKRMGASRIGKKHTPERIAKIIAAKARNKAARLLDK